MKTTFTTMTDREIERERIEKLIKDNTQGSGLNYEYNYRWKGNILTIDTYYQLMNDSGYYVGSTPVKVKIDTADMSVISIRCSNTKKYCYGLRDWLDDTFFYGLEKIEQ